MTINVPMCARDALLLPIGAGVGHRGLWFADPAVYPVAVGDGVSFVSAGAEVAAGVVTGIGAAEMSEEFRRYCERVHGTVFRWEEKA